MEGCKRVLVELNKILTNELTAINQYFLHARMHKNWGFEELNSKDYKASIKAMKMADDIIQRILFLEGLPNLQQLGKLYIGESAEEAIVCDLKLTGAHIAALRAAITVTEEESDYVSRDILTDILEEKEEWYDWVETQIEQIKDLTLPNYLQSQL